MNERARRLWAGAEADAVGYSGIAAVAASDEAQPGVDLTHEDAEDVAHQVCVEGNEVAQRVREREVPVAHRYVRDDSVSRAAVSAMRLPVQLGRCRAPGS